MALDRHLLPHLAGKLFLTDGGIETTLMFREGLDLPEFAAFTLLDSPAGTTSLQRYFSTYASLAGNYNVGLVLESATWRANTDWGVKLGYTSAALAGMNQKAIALLQDIRREYETEQSPMAISGCIGPRGDGYVPSCAMTTAEAQHYHLPQIVAFRDAGADFVTAVTMNYVEEAIGIVRAARSQAIPVVISFTVETDGKLPTGKSLQEAIVQVDRATNRGPAYYMINCAHPKHFADQLVGEGAWLHRIRGIRANASTKSHAELDDAETLDEGNPIELGQQFRDLVGRLPHLTVLGGCCGTDSRHIEAICKASLPVLWTHLSTGGSLAEQIAPTPSRRLVR